MAVKNVNSRGKREKEKGFPVVAIGASAGGLEAVKELLQRLSPDTGLAYVFIQHLDPNHESMLVPILSRLTKMKVIEATHKLKLQRNELYIIPPNRNMAVIDGIIALDPRKPKPYINMPVDQFFTSLAAKHAEGSIGIVLSGNANDGTAGLRAIKAAGGITFAQDESARFSGMPKSAIAEGVVDLVMSPTLIAAEIERISKQPEAVARIDEEEADAVGNMQDLTNILQMLKKLVGVDFSHYKPNTIRRRINRRMVLQKLDTIPEYYEFIRTNTGEATLLYGDLLIHVTSFFRDPDTLEFVKKTILPAVLKAKSANAPLRIWVPACSSGEEAYSLAIILMELKEDGFDHVPIQIFATDLSEVAIAKARLAIYKIDDVTAVSDSRLEKFFVKTDGQYRISKVIRDMCIFAPHNIFKDPPFSRLDVISCCNLFIYLDQPLQKKIIGTFYYALGPEGFLILGKSETINASGQLFSQLEKKFKVYSKKSDAAASAMTDMSLRLPRASGSSDKETQQKWNPKKTEVPQVTRVVDELLAEKFIPATVVVNDDMEILQFRGDTATFFEPARGKASLNLLKMIRKELAFELKNTILKASRSGRPEKKSGLKIEIKDLSYLVSIEVIPLKELSDERLNLVIFEEFPITVVQDPIVSFSKEEAVKTLMEELTTVREDMRSIIEDQEAGQEELQTANEEIISSNEELQSINEELETSKEEIESSNEELMTINSELQIRNEQLTEAQEYAESIFETILEAVVLIDPFSQVIMANHSFYRIFKVTPRETEGKSLYELGNRQWDSQKLRELVNKIQADGSQFDGFEIEHTFPVIGIKIMQINGRKIIQKVKRKEVVLLAIEDITQFRQAQQVLAEREAWFRNIADNAPVMIWMSDTGKSRNFFNSTWLRFTGRSKEQEMMSGWANGLHPDDKKEYLARYDSAFDQKVEFKMEYRLRRQDGNFRWVLDSGKPFFSADNKFIGYIGSVAEVHDARMIQRELENQVEMRTRDLQASNKELERSNNELQQFAYVASHDLQEPLRKVMTFSNRLLDNKDLIPAEEVNFINRISMSVHRMSGMIDDLLNFSRTSRPGQQILPVHLGRMINNMLPDFDLILKEKSGVIGVDVPQTIDAIPVQMEQLFHNLISNAVKFSRENTPPVVHIVSQELTKEEVSQIAGLSEQKKYLQITVSDNGIGFENQFAEQIFVIFQRLNERQRYPGSGIGLALCKKIVDNHNGKIFTSSEEGVGTVFTIILPFENK